MTGRSRVALALSGGVDSSVAAALLLDRGHEVVALTMDLGRAHLGGEGPAGGPEPARAAAAHLGLEHHVVDLAEPFEREVLLPALRDYERGRTPNPCVLCNGRVKLGLLAAAARDLGAGLLATGHHARLLAGPAGPLLARGRDPDKDQSYFLFDLAPSQLAALVLPIGELTKAEVRARAEALGLPAARAEESQDLCVAARGRPGETLGEALRRRFGAAARPGALVAPDGRVLGRHEGLHRFTVGQRRGLGVELGRRAWVTRIDGERGEVVVSHQPSDLLSVGLEASGVRWAEPAPAEAPLRCLAQIRSRHRPAPAEVSRLAEGRARVRFDRPQAAVTPGQAVVFYRDDLVLGGGWIDRAG